MMRKKSTFKNLSNKRWVFVVMFLQVFILTNLSANNLATMLVDGRPIKGVVLDEKNIPIPFASVQIKGTESGTTTNENGEFTIEANDEDVLVISYLGYDNMEIAVGSQSLISIKMVPSESQLDQVVVVAYGFQKKRAVTGAISSVKGEQLSKQPLLTAVQGIQGLAPGIRIVGSSQPGAQPRVTIRGLGTILTDENPLYVVDGILTDNITNINTADIVSVDVLKDGSAAMYGSRSANGVVLITTNKGTTGKPKFSIDTYTGFRKLTNIVDMADRDQYLTYTNEARAYDGAGQIGTFDGTANTDWFKEISQNGVLRNVNLNVNGGTENFTYLFSAGYLKDEGVIKGADYNRLTLRSNNEFSVTKSLKIGNTFSVGLANSDNKSNGIFTDAYRASPAAPVVDSKGAYGFQPGLSAAGNPVANLELTNDKGKNVRLQGSLYGELKLFKGMTVKSSIGMDDERSNKLVYDPVYNYGTFSKAVSELRTSDGNKKNWILTNTLNYNADLTDDHNIDLILGNSAEQGTGRSGELRVANVPAQENLWYLSKGDPSTLVLLSDNGFKIRRSSVFGRANYSFKDRYNLSGVIRRDGSSAFPENQKYGTFYSAGASWIVSDEAFFNRGFFETLKLRVGYAKLGNDAISRLVSNELSALLSVTNTTPYAFPNALVQGITFDQIKDALATWETTKGFDAGMEFGILGNKLQGEISYYNKLTNAYLRVPTPAFVDANGILSQAADVRNSGVEANLSYRKLVNDNFSWRMGVNATFNKNNVEKVRGGINLKEGGLGNGEVTTSTVEGQPIGSFWLYEVEGIFQNQAEIDNSAAVTGTLPGDFKYRDVNNDKTIDERDRVFSGSYQPKLYYGVNGSFNYKALDFSVECYGNTGNKVYNGKKAVRFGNENIEAVRIDRWTSSNTASEEYRASNAIPKPSTYFLESGSFFRINNITLGYALPASLVDNAGLGKTRLFVSAQNPITIKKFTGFSPELPGSNALNSGIELFVYPITATYMLGLNINFK